MKIKLRPVISGELRKGDCELCDKAWRLYRKGERLEKSGLKEHSKNSNKDKLRRGHWLKILSAKVLCEDWANHFDTPRRCPLYICSGRARKVANVRCWNCNRRFRLAVSEWHETPICTYCLAPPCYKWYETGEFTRKEVRAWGYERSIPPYASLGAWKTLRWSKKKMDTVPVKGVTHV